MMLQRFGMTCLMMYIQPVLSFRKKLKTYIFAERLSIPTLVSGFFPVFMMLIPAMSLVILLWISAFYPIALKGFRGIVFIHGVWMGGSVGEWGKLCPDCILETVRYRKLILIGTLVRGCRCATSWCDLDLTLTYKILSGLYHRNCKV